MQSPLDSVIEPTLPQQSPRRPPAKQYDAAIFFDNDPKQIELVREHCNARRVEVVQIPDTRELKGDNIISIGEKVGLTQKNNTYIAMRVKQSQALGRAAGERYDEKSGIQKVHLQQLVQWLEKTSDTANRVALFDWDRTLSMFEGVTLVEAEHRDFKFEDPVTGAPAYSVDQIREDTLIFLMGRERLEILREMMRLLLRNNVDVAIVTNNTSCPNVHTMTYFNGLVQQLMQNVPFSIVCSLPYRGNKGIALSTHYPNICHKQTKRDDSPVRTRINRL